ncbi:hypothetical protein BZA05DRAFT_208150 [Tricharina praecox]|uniref:uncharacterized protein n=1 Tax=Tricharina praecox TaxID=43433 RepID=UPI002220E7FC|nr:uncharacterized protein BZA05DRAFT_208150 [Tricharina praecox]KAI5842085.1 hypothetical protein BZA05DRAFT_208150 [Tricharina praecox]
MSRNARRGAAMQGGSGLAVRSDCNPSRRQKRRGGEDAMFRRVTTGGVRSRLLRASNVTRSAVYNFCVCLFFVFVFCFFCCVPTLIHLESGGGGGWRRRGVGRTRTGRHCMGLRDCAVCVPRLCYVRHSTTDQRSPTRCLGISMLWRDTGNERREGRYEV